MGARNMIARGVAIAGEALTAVYLLVLAPADLRSQIRERPATIVHIASIGSDKADEDFYSPKSFALGKDGDIIILDSGNSRIQRFSSSGSFKGSFGRYGQGPGELSKEASLVKVLADGNVYVIDNTLRRINIYDNNDKSLRTIATNASYDDILLIDNTYYLSNLILRKGYSPISRTDDLSRIKDSFGEIIEPTMGVIDTIKSGPAARILENEFTFMNMTSLSCDKDGNIFYSQLQPYVIEKYDQSGRKISKITGETPFDTHFPLIIKINDNSITKKVTGPVPIVYPLIWRATGEFVVPIISPDRSYIFFDFYTTDCKFIKRCRAENSLYDFRKSAGITNIIIDNEDILYCLIISREDNPILSMNKITFH
jgi:NHL repeat